jgi:transporter family-2 protein
MRVAFMPMRTRSAAVAAPIAGALLVGVLTATQAKVVGNFHDFTQNSAEFVLVNYAIGLSVLSLLVISRKSLRHAVVALPSLVRSRQLRWYQCLGGVLGSWLVVSSSLCVPELGLSLYVVALISGLISAGVVVDALGFGPAGRKPPSLPRILGALIALAAVTLEVAPELLSNGWSDEAPIYSLLAFSAGCGVAVQQAINGRVARATGEPLVSGWLNFATGAVALLLVTVLLAAIQVTPLEAIRDMPWWAITPGFLGAAFVSLAAWSVGAIGVLRLGLLSVAGQIITALVFDVVNPKIGISMDQRTALASALALLAAYVSSRVPRSAKASAQ